MSNFYVVPKENIHNYFQICTPPFSSYVCEVRFVSSVSTKTSQQTGCKSTNKNPTALPPIKLVIKYIYQNVKQCHSHFGWKIVINKNVICLFNEFVNVIFKWNN